MIQRIAKNADIKFCVSDDAKIQDKFIIRFYTVDKSKAIIRTADNAITASLNTETCERKEADSTLTAITTNLDTRLKNLENQEYQTVWDFGTY